MATGDSYHPLPPIPQEFHDRYNAHEEQSNLQYSRRDSQNNSQHTSPKFNGSVKRKSVPTPTPQQPEMRLQQAPASPVSVNPPKLGLRQSDVGEISHMYPDEYDSGSRPSSGGDNLYAPAPTWQADSGMLLPIRSRQSKAAAEMRHSRASSLDNIPRTGEGEQYLKAEDEHTPQIEALQYHAFNESPKKKDKRMSQMNAHTRASSGDPHSRPSSTQLDVPRSISMPLSRPTSSYFGTEMRGRTLSPLSASGSDHGSPHPYSRESSARRSPASRPVSYIDLLNNVPHSQQVAPGGPMNHETLQNAVGNAASLLDTKKTLEMYRLNVRKTNDAAVQYEFAVLMVNTARDATASSGMDSAGLITEAKHILQRLADRAYPFAQYYLGDGYFSGLFNKDKPDHDKALPLFVAASKHGHAEAGYRAALCYEFGWGTSKSYPKAVQFFRASASKNHPGAETRLGLACIHGDMGLVPREKYREGVKWLKRAQESADFQYNAAPYELGVLHLKGYGDDIFKDEAYAAQLLTQAAELGHVQANFVMGQTYENGYYGCPRDAALSVHFYNGAATKGHPEAMMALCAWYMVGAEPVMEKDEAEACAWAVQAAETGYAKAEYAVGYFTEMGIGCRRDPLEANVWYVRAADQGYEAAIQRLQIIRAATSGGPGNPVLGKAEVLAGKAEVKKEKKKFMGIF